MEKTFLSILLFLLTLGISAQSIKRNLQAYRINSEIKIDGVLDEEIWTRVTGTQDFLQYEPYNGRTSSFETIVKILYNNDAIYIGAHLKDNYPDSIMKQLGRRDEIGQTDFFGISIDPFNDALNAYTFIVTPQNVQFDARETEEEDESWDAVWKSEVSITSDGWVVEMQIPYSALRFPKKEVQLWGLNMVRNVHRSLEKSFWNFVDPKIEGFNKQMGELQGISEVDAPIRLSVTPYLSGYLLKNSANAHFDYSIKGGMDVKYGINESYTLDMMLIPDFGQVESDDKVLNISAFETYYEDKRPFFTEGTDLFNKGQIFYSRRIGSVKSEYLEKDFVLNANEIVSNNPYEAPLINVTKISGKGRKGLGIGFLNGMAAATYATIKDTASGITRTVQAQPFTNYNVLVFDQSLKNNSYVSLTNTNYLQPNSQYKSNVTSTQFHLESKKGKYALEGVFGVSYQDGLDKNNALGSGYNVAIKKIAGNFQFETSQELIFKTFDDNDLGYIEKTDEMKTEVEVAYNIYEPFGRVLKLYNKVEFIQSTLFSRREKMGNSIEYSGFTTFKNYLSLKLDAQLVMGKYNDFYEPRTDGRVFVRPGIFVIGGFISPDYRKKFMADIKYGYWGATSDNIWGYWFGVMPRIRFNENFNLNGGVNFNTDLNDQGFVTKTANSDTIYMAQRTVKTLVNSLTVNYLFNSTVALSLKMRHYWSLINYSQFYTLTMDGSLEDAPNFSAPDINTNYFNIDLVYTWRFAPGSELSLVWKNAIENENSNAVFNYSRNFSDLLNFDKQNSISLRILYYIDYIQVKRKLKN